MDFKEGLEKQWETGLERTGTRLRDSVRSEGNVKSKCLWVLTKSDKWKGSGSLKIKILVLALFLHETMVHWDKSVPFSESQVPQYKVGDLLKWFRRSLQLRQDRGQRTSYLCRDWPPGRAARAEAPSGRGGEGRWKKKAGHPGFKTNLPLAKVLLSLILQK